MLELQHLFFLFFPSIHSEHIHKSSNLLSPVFNLLDDQVHYTEITKKKYIKNLSYLIMLLPPLQRSHISTSYPFQGSTVDTSLIPPCPFSSTDKRITLPITIRFFST